MAFRFALDGPAVLKSAMMGNAYIRVHPAMRFETPIDEEGSTREKEAAIHEQEFKSNPGSSCVAG